MCHANCDTKTKYIVKVDELNRTHNLFTRTKEREEKGSNDDKVNYVNCPYVNVLYRSMLLNAYFMLNFFVENQTTGKILKFISKKGECDGRKLRRF